MRIKQTSTESDIDALLSGDETTLRDRLVAYVKNMNKYIYILGLSSGFMGGMLAMILLYVLDNFLK